jgi:hypothetical protein
MTTKVNTDMFGNDLTRADSFGTPRSKPVNAVTAPIRTGAGEQAGLDLIVDGDEQRGELPMLRVHVDDENYDLASFDVDETGKPLGVRKGNPAARQQSRRPWLRRWSRCSGFYGY